jgi:hypothetical protein
MDGKDTIKKELLKIERRYGSIEPGTVVEVARPISSPLHKYFEWDNSKAAEGYRLWQARQLVAIVTFTRGEDTIRSFTNVMLLRDDESLQGYVSTGRVLENQELRQQVVERALTELRGWAQKYRHLSELKSISQQLEKVCNQFEKRQLQPV